MADVRDVSCSAARTADLVRRQRTLPGPRVPPQLDALSPETDLVTVTIGGNDLGLFARAVRGAPETSPRMVGRVGRRVASALGSVRAKAPSAVVVLVGYARLVEPGARCSRRLPFSSAQLGAANALQRRLNQALRVAAESAGVLFVDMYARSQGHGVCSDDPWMNGRGTEPGRAAAYHPFLAGMEATAQAVEQTLSLQP